MEIRMRFGDADTLCAGEKASDLKWSQCRFTKYPMSGQGTRAEVHPGIATPNYRRLHHSHSTIIADIIPRSIQ
jgi:hypothetical protein